MPVDLLATLTAGLGPNSRVAMAINKQTAPPDTMFLAEILDSINLILWSLAGKGKKPESVAAALLVQDKPKKNIKGFANGQDLLAERDKIIKRIINQRSKKDA